MPWDTDATQRKLLEAGARQFASAGFAGARIEAIGADAGVNKERIYRYFGDKRAFFAAVLEHELTELLDGVGVVGTGTDAVRGFMDQLLDRCDERPELSRLLVWESLELADPVALEKRRPHCAQKVAEIVTALPSLSRDDAERLLFSLLTLAVGWCEFGNLAASVISAPMDRTTQRSTLLEHAVGLAEAVS